MKYLALALAAAACVAPFAPMGSGPMGPAPMGATPTDMHEAFARSAGYPTRKSPEQLESTAHQMTAKYKLLKKSAGTLEALTPIAIEGKRGVCYAVVLRLADGATWDVGAETGMLFDYSSPSGGSKAGPGLVGPGAVGALPCADSDGRITMRLSALDGNPRGAPIGHGAYTVELWSHVQTRAEAASFAADQQKQERDYRAFKAEDDAKKAKVAQQGCSKCEARFQGCVGSGRSNSSCDSDYRSCAFEQVGADYTSSCPNP